MSPSGKRHPSYCRGAVAFATGTTCAQACTLRARSAVSSNGVAPPPDTRQGGGAPTGTRTSANRSRVISLRALVLVVAHLSPRRTGFTDLRADPILVMVGTVGHGSLLVRYLEPCGFSRIRCSFHHRSRHVRPGVDVLLLTCVLAERTHADTRAALPNIDAKLSADILMRKPQRRATAGVFSSASRRSLALRNLKN